MIVLTKYSEELEKYERAKRANGGNDKLKAPKWLTILYQTSHQKQW